MVAPPPPWSLGKRIKMMSKGEKLNKVYKLQNKPPQMNLNRVGGGGDDRNAQYISLEPCPLMNRGKKKKKNMEY